MEIGKAVSRLQAMDDALQSVARAIDADPGNKKDQARARALAVRQIVHDSCEAVLRYTAAAGGARPLCHDPAQARRAADLYVYLAQHHGGRDAVSLGRLTVEGRRCNLIGDRTNLIASVCRVSNGPGVFDGLPLSSYQSGGSPIRGPIRVGRRHRWSQ